MQTYVLPRNPFVRSLHIIEKRYLIIVQIVTRLNVDCRYNQCKNLLIVRVSPNNLCKNPQKITHQPQNSYLNLFIFKILKKKYISVAMVFMVYIHSSVAMVLFPIK